MIADHLARRGLVVLRTDARGYGQSTGKNDWESYTTDDRIEDNRAILNFLKQQPDVAADRIVLLGHSEGAMIAAALAASEESPALVVLLSTSALPGNEVFAQQMADNLRRQGATEDVAKAVHEQLLRFADLLVNDRENRPRFEALALDFLAAHGVPDEDLDPKFAQGLLEGYLQAPWYWRFVSLDPREHLKQVHAPLLAVFAGADQQVPWQTHLPSLIGALSEGGNADFAATVLPEQDHFFLEFEGRRLERHVPGKMHVADELLAAIDAELSRRGLLESPRPVETSGGASRSSNESPRASESNTLSPDVNPDGSRKRSRPLMDWSNDHLPTGRSFVCSRVGYVSS
jgi:pimeloyl-ACP methyl ester carboxylesterase